MLRSVAEREEALRVLPEDAAADDVGEVPSLPERAGRVGEVGIPVRVVARVEDEVRAERFGGERDRRLLGLARHVELAARDVLARLPPARRREPPALLEVL